MPKQVKQGNKSVYVENNYGKIIVNKFFKLRYLSIALFFIAIVVVAFWQKDQIKIWLGMDRIFSQESTAFKVLILPFNKTCSYAGKEHDIGFVIKQRIDSISKKNDLAIQSYYFSTFDSKNLDDNKAEEQLFYHYSDIIVFGNYETCSAQEEVCLKYITSLTDTTGSKYGEMRDLKKGYLQSKVESAAAYFSFLGKIKHFQPNQFDKLVQDYNKFGEIDDGGLYVLLSKKLINMKEYENAVKAYLYGCQKLHSIFSDTTESTFIFLYNMKDIYESVVGNIAIRSIFQKKRKYFFALYQDSKDKLRNKPHYWKLNFLELHNVILCTPEHDFSQNLVMFEDMISLIEAMPYQNEMALPSTYLYSGYAIYKYIYANLGGVKVVYNNEIIGNFEKSLHHSQKIIHIPDEYRQEIYGLLRTNVVLLYLLYSEKNQPFDEDLLLHAIDILENTGSAPMLGNTELIDKLQDYEDIKNMRLNLYYQAFKLCHRKEQIEKSLLYASKGFYLGYEYFSANPKDFESAARMMQLFDAFINTIKQGYKKIKNLKDLMANKSEDDLSDSEIEQIDEEKELIDFIMQNGKETLKALETMIRKLADSKLNHFTDKDWEKLDEILHDKPYNFPNSYSAKDLFLECKNLSK